MSDAQTTNTGDATTESAHAHLEQRVDELSGLVDSLLDDQVMLEQQVEDQQEEIEALREELAAEKERVRELDDRTDLLNLVDDVDTMSPKNRRTVILQNLYRKARKEEKRGRDAVASMTRADVEQVLQHPDLDRTTLYNDMREATKMIPDAGVCSYQSATGGDSRIVLDLEKGEVPAQFQGGSE